MWKKKQEEQQWYDGEGRVSHFGHYKAGEIIEIQAKELKATKESLDLTRKELATVQQRERKEKEEKERQELLAMFPINSMVGWLGLVWYVQAIDTPDLVYVGESGFGRIEHPSPRVVLARYPNPESDVVITYLDKDTAKALIKEVPVAS